MGRHNLAIRIEASPEVVFTTRPRTFVGKLLTPVETILSGMMRSVVRRDLESTKADIERNTSG